MEHKLAMPHSHDSVHSHASVFSDHPVPTGTALGFALLFPHFLLSDSLSVSFAALLISLIAGVYFGFAVTNGTTREQLIEFSVAGLFLLAALLGIAIWPGIIALAYLCHAGWDLAHHNRARLSLVHIPSWYVPSCVIVDVIIGVGLIIVWRSRDLI